MNILTVPTTDLLSLAQQPGSQGLPIWAMILLGILLIAVVLGFVLGSRTKEPEDQTRSESTSVEEAPPARFSSAVPPIPQTGAQSPASPFGPIDTLEEAEPGLENDDLTIIDGIGPGIMTVLNGAGIYTFNQLGQISVDDLREIIRKSGLRSDDPATWPRQARLAADGKYDELKELQANLKSEQD